MSTAVPVPSPSSSLPSSSKPATMVGTATAAAAAAKQTPTKMHRRSRTGCFTCRLRRKKCDEGKPCCRACKHLGLKCEYKRPMWWSNNEQRRQQKESIKNLIKRTKMSEKSAQNMALHASTPPSLCNSMPTSETFSDGLPRTRAVSVDSQFSLDAGFNFNQVTTEDLFSSAVMAPPQYAPCYPCPSFAPYEVDIKTEQQTFINDIPIRRDSSVSTFSTFNPPPLPGHVLPPDNWVHQDIFETRRESLPEEPLDFNFFELPHVPFSPNHQAVIQVEDCDQHLLNHFVDNVLRLIFPILDVNQHGSARSDVILPALESNKCYLHCCLSIAALHLKATEGLVGEQIDNDILRHRYAAVSELCEALNRDEDHAQILEATLGMIFFQCSVGRPDDSLPDIPWHQHFQAATSLIQKLELPQHLLALSQTHTQPPFNMTLAAWIDVLGATMLGRKPAFADTYREKLGAGAPTGLAELMGCEDRIMYLISEIASLEAHKAEGILDDVSLCAYITELGKQITLTDPGPATLASAYSSTGAVRPRQLSRNMTAVFRLAARIYLCSLVPDFDRAQPSITNLVDSLTEAMAYIPAGPDGFDRSLVWPLLIAGSVAMPASSFRTMFLDRCAALGEASEFGSFGRVRELLKDVWRLNDDGLARGDKRNVHWRDVMRQKAWDFLLI